MRPFSWQKILYSWKKYRKCYPISCMYVEISTFSWFLLKYATYNLVILIFSSYKDDFYYSGGLPLWYCSFFSNRVLIICSNRLLRLKIYEYFVLKYNLRFRVLIMPRKKNILPRLLSLWETPKRFYQVLKLVPIILNSILFWYGSIWFQQVVSALMHCFDDLILIYP